jgi:endonuclease/exonuclease/phosphatase family metal-dependent hydrolase
VAKPLRRRTVLATLGIAVLVLVLLTGHYLQAWTTTLTPANVKVYQRFELAALAWDAVPQATGYLVTYTPQSTHASTVRVAVEKPVSVITTLTANLVYEARVAATFNGWQLSPWSAPVTFTAQDRQYPLAAPVIEAIPGLTTIDATWPDTAKDAKYEIGVGTDPGDLKVSSTDDASYSFSELEQRTTYYLSARILWSGGEAASAWSTPIKVKTSAPTALRVGSFNVKCASCSGGKSWSSRRSAVINTIRGQNIDVIGIQEANQARMKGSSTSQLANLLAGLGSGYAVANCTGSRPGASCHVSRGGPNHGDSIIYNTATVELLRGGAVQLPRGPGIARYLVWGLFRQKATGQTFIFGSTHLTPGKKQGSNRRKQAHVVGQTLTKLRAGHVPAIVVGDFNSYDNLPGGNTIYAAIASHGFYDPLAQGAVATSTTTTAKKTIHTEYSSYNDYKRTPPRHGTYLDYIFLTKMRVSEWETVVDATASGQFIGTIPSDHNMVRADVWLP